MSNVRNPLVRSLTDPIKSQANTSFLESNEFISSLLLANTKENRIDKLLLEMNFEMKDMGFSEDQIKRTMTLVIHEAIEFLSWIPKKSQNEEAKEDLLPITIVHYENKLLHSMRAILLKASQWNYSPDRMVHKRDREIGKSKNKYDTFTSKGINFQKTKVIIPCCYGSKLGITGSDLKYVVQSYKNNLNPESITVYLGAYENTSISASESCKEAEEKYKSWSKNNNFLDSNPDFLKVKKLHQVELMEMPEYIEAKNIFLEIALQDIGIQKAIKLDVEDYFKRKKNQGKKEEVYGANLESGISGITEVRETVVATLLSNGRKLTDDQIETLAKFSFLYDKYGASVITSGAGAQQTPINNNQNRVSIFTHSLFQKNSTSSCSANAAENSEVVDGEPHKLSSKA